MGACAVTGVAADVLLTAGASVSLPAEATTRRRLAAAGRPLARWLADAARSGWAVRGIMVDIIMVSGWKE
jgi:hypothetical protein